MVSRIHYTTETAFIFVALNYQTGVGALGKAREKQLKADPNDGQLMSVGQIVQKENVTLAEFAKDFFDWNGKWQLISR